MAGTLEADSTSGAVTRTKVDPEVGWTLGTQGPVATTTVGARGCIAYVTDMPVVQLASQPAIETRVFAAAGRPVVGHSFPAQRSPPNLSVVRPRFVQADPQQAIVSEPLDGHLGVSL